MSRIYKRHFRYSLYSKLRHATYFQAFLEAESERLAGSGTGATVTFANATNQMTLAANPYVSGDGPFLLANDGGALPAELDNITDYWINLVGGDIMTLHLTEADAIAGDNIVAFTDDGTGTNSILVSAEAIDIFVALKSGKSADEIRGITNIDDL